MLTILAAATAGPVAHWAPGLMWIRPLLALLLLGAVITVIVLLARRGARGPSADYTAAARSAEATLAERFARGEIDEGEYRARLDVLRGGGSTPSSSAG